MHSLPLSVLSSDGIIPVRRLITAETGHFEPEWAADSPFCLTDVDQIGSYQSHEKVNWESSICSVMVLLPLSFALSPYLMTVIPAWYRWGGQNGVFIIHIFILPCCNFWVFSRRCIIVVVLAVWLVFEVFLLRTVAPTMWESGMKNDSWHLANIHVTQPAAVYNHCVCVFY